MGTYRTSRNIEASFVDYLKTEIDASWSNIQVEKVFSRIYELALPAICIRLNTTAHIPVQLGDTSTKRNPQILIDIFADNDGQRLDLKDFIVSKIKGGLPYYEYEIENGQTKTKTLSGRITILNIDDAPVSPDTNKDALDVHDRYRHLLTISVETGKVEA